MNMNSRKTMKTRTTILGRLVLGLVLGLVVITTGVLNAQPPVRTLVADALPWGVTWQDTDSTIAMKAISSDSTIAGSITRPEPGVMKIEGTKFSKFIAREMTIRLNEERGIITTEWTFTGTRILTPIGIYDYLLPALKMELGEPNARPDTLLTTAEIRGTTKNDNILYKELRENDFTLYSQWTARKNGRDLVVDLRVDNETGLTTLSISDRKAQQEAVAAEKEKAPEAAVTEVSEAGGLSDSASDNPAEEAPIQIDPEMNTGSTADPAAADDSAKEGSNLETSS